MGIIPFLCNHLKVCLDAVLIGHVLFMADSIGFDGNRICGQRCNSPRLIYPLCIRAIRTIADLPDVLHIGKVTVPHIAVVRFFNFDEIGSAVCSNDIALVNRGREIFIIIGDRLLQLLGLFPCQGAIGAGQHIDLNIGIFCQKALLRSAGEDGVHSIGIGKARQFQCFQQALAVFIAASGLQHGSRFIQIKLQLGIDGKPQHQMAIFHRGKLLFPFPHIGHHDVSLAAGTQSKDNSQHQGQG